MNFFINVASGRYQINIDDHIQNCHQFTCKTLNYIARYPLGNHLLIDPAQIPNDPDTHTMQSYIDQTLGGAANRQQAYNIHHNPNILAPAGSIIYFLYHGQLMHTMIAYDVNHWSGANNIGTLGERLNQYINQLQAPFPQLILNMDQKVSGHDNFNEGWNNNNQWINTYGNLLDVYFIPFVR